VSSEVEISTPDLSDAHPEVGVLARQWRDFGARRAFSGRAVTIKCHEDNSLVKAAVAEAGEGRVLVVDGGASLRRALLGDQVAETAARNGWAGCVIDGAVRDVEALAEIDLGIKALGACPVRTDKREQGLRDEVVEIGGARIAPGDYIYADANGVICSPAPLS
jgi:regulator of ribonuclease activity A